MGRLGALLGVLVAASIAASCGEGVSSQRGPNEDPETHLAAAKKLSGAKEDAANAHAKAKKANGRYSSEAAVAEMSVFSRPRTEQDALPNSFAYLLKDSCDDRLRAEGRCPGDAIAAESRLLLTDLGVRKTSLYAWPTTNGWVCWGLVDSGASCIAHFPAEQPRIAYGGIDPDDEGTGYPGMLVAIAADEVASAEVQVLGVRHAATLGRNGVFYELTDRSCTMRAFEALAATASDGSSGSTAIDWAHGPTLDGEHPANVNPESCAG
jgi:hypothetical protein